LSNADEVLRGQQAVVLGCHARDPRRRNPVVAKRLAPAVGVDGVVGVQPVEARGREALRGPNADDRFTPGSVLGCETRKITKRSGWGRPVGNPWRRAEERPMNSSGLLAGKFVMFSDAHALWPPDASAKRTASPRTLPFLSELRRAKYGLPDPFDRRTTVLTVSPCRCSAVVRAAAAAVR